MLTDFLYRLRALFRRKSVEAEMSEELRAHLDHQTEKYVRAGLPLEEAKRRARIDLGGLDQVKEECRDSWGVRFINEVAQDLRYALRQLRRNPGFTIVAVLTLALGIGANTAIFSLIDAVMLRSLPVRDPGQLVVLNWTAHQPWNGSVETSYFGDCDSGSDKNPSGCSFPYPFLESLRSDKKAFSGVTAFAGPAGLVLSGNGPARLVNGELVSGDYFLTLGVSAALGRTLGANDDSLNATPAVVLSYDFWQDAFGGERSAVGRTIQLNGVPFTIVGVADPHFLTHSPGNTQDFFLTLSMLPRLNIGWGKDSRTFNNWWLVILARMRPGVPLARAQASASLLFRDEVLHGAKPLSKASDDPRIVLVPAQQGLTGERGDLAALLYVLMAAVGLILLIACANVAGLLLSRAASRQKEMAVRLSLGAGRGRIVRQLLTESLLLSLAGGAVGSLLAVWGVRGLTAFFSSAVGQSFPFTVGPDWRVLVFTISISVFTGILFGLAPAFRGTRLDLTPALKENASTLPGGVERASRRFHLASVLVATQAALSMVALIGAGLLVRTLANLHSVDPGFDTRNVLTFGIDPTLENYKDAQIRTLYSSLQEKFAALPGVLSASYSSDVLLSGSLWTETVHVEGQPEKSKTEVDMLAAGPDFIKTMRIPLVAGRMFSGQDFQQAVAASSTEAPLAEPAAAKSSAAASPGPPIPVLVNHAFVRKYFAGKNPLGRRLTEGGNSGASGEGVAVAEPKTKTWEIIGVVGDTKYNSLSREIHPTVYVPLIGGGAHFELRTAANPTALIPVVRKIVEQTDKDLPLSQVRTETQTIENQLARQRVVAELASFFGLLALALACLGLYGLLSYEVTRRTREIGIRMALGAQKGDVLRMVVGQGIRLTLPGVAVGIAGALGLTRFLASLLFGVRPTDPVTFIAVSLILVAVGLLACYIPARRAAKVDPMVALRYE
jgi:predicted permease